MKIKDMERIFVQTQSELKTFLASILTEKYGEENVVSEDGYLYARGTHPVLLVAHMDTVHKSPPKDIFYNKTRTKCLAMEGIGGDDRCGVIIILDIIEHLNCSVVFTEDEETGCVGAKKFCTSGIELNANYAIEVDRKGSNDYVFYKDYNADFESLIKKFGFTKGYGSCSDITHIAPAFKLECVNISSGYYRPHTNDEYVDFDEMRDITGRLLQLIAEETPKYAYVENKEVVRKTTTKYDGGYYRDYYYDDDWWDATYRPLKIKRGQCNILQQGNPVNFGVAWIDKDDNVFLDKKLTKQLFNTSLFTKEGRKTTYYGLKYSFPKQVMSATEYNNRGITTTPAPEEVICLDCGDIIEDDDLIGISNKICPECRNFYKAQYGIEFSEK